LVISGYSIIFGSVTVSLFCPTTVSILCSYWSSNCMGFDSESCGSIIFSLVVSEFGSFGGEISYSAGVF